MTKLDKFAIVDTTFNIDRMEKMSTKERYGTYVYEALIAQTRFYAYGVDIWATVGEIAIVARVSRATAKKYLEVLVEMGHAKSMKFGNRTGYRPVSSNE